nr:MAG TPA: hypothetical protein [Caudoviricetes sp.]
MLYNIACAISVCNAIIPQGSTGLASQEVL